MCVNVNDILVQFTTILQNLLSLLYYYYTHGLLTFLTIISVLSFIFSSFPQIMEITDN